MQDLFDHVTLQRSEIFVHLTEDRESPALSSGNSAPEKVGTPDEVKRFPIPRN